ncbi:MAG: hypothetical protein WCO77_09810 [bacterium]
MHINLIYEEEQRSASPVSLKLVINLAVVALVVMILLGTFKFYSSYRSLQNLVQAKTTELKMLDSKYKAAIQTRNDLAGQGDVLKEIQVFRNTRMAWGAQLQNIQSAVPSVIQLMELRMSQTVLSLSNNISARVFEVRMTGRTAAERAEVNVVQFLDSLKVPPFAGVVETATLPPGAFRQDPVNKADRVFEIICKYVPKPLE